MAIVCRDIGVKFTKPSLVQPQFKSEADINNMIRRFLNGDMSVLKHRNEFPTLDLRNAPDSLHEALNVRSKADYLWHTLPEQVRASYGSIDRFVAAYEAAVNAPVKDDKSDNPVSTEAKNGESTEAAATAEVQPKSNT